MPSYIKTDSHISIVFDDGQPATVYSSSPNFGPLLEALKSGDWEVVRDFACPVEIIKKQVATLGTSRVTVENAMVCFDGNPLHNTLTDRMLSMHEDGFDVTHLALFLERLMSNPSFRAVNELYGFLEASKLPITEDGHFLAYKRINGDFMDSYTGTIDNSPGQIVVMPRNQVNEDKDQTCSTGLHFCAREYLPHYGAGPTSKVVMVKIDPADVVSIPSDYNNAKGRCCRYEVIRELPFDGNGGWSSGYVPNEKLEQPFINTSAPRQEKTACSVAKISNGIVMAYYASPREAQTITGVDASSITKVCNGDRKSAGGYQWEWEIPKDSKATPVADWEEDEEEEDEEDYQYRHHHYEDEEDEEDWDDYDDGWYR